MEQQRMESIYIQQSEVSLQNAVQLKEKLLKFEGKSLRNALRIVWTTIRSGFSVGSNGWSESLSLLCHFLPLFQSTGIFTLDEISQEKSEIQFEIKIQNKNQQQEEIKDGIIEAYLPLHFSSEYWVIIQQSLLNSSKEIQKIGLYLLQNTSQLITQYNDQQQDVKIQKIPTQIIAQYQSPLFQLYINSTEAQKSAIYAVQNWDLYIATFKGYNEILLHLITPLWKNIEAISALNIQDNKYEIQFSWIAILLIRGLRHQTVQAKRDTLIRIMQSFLNGNSPSNSCLVQRISASFVINYIMPTLNEQYHYNPHLEKIKLKNLTQIQPLNEIQQKKEIQNYEEISFYKTVHLFLIQFFYKFPFIDNYYLNNKQEIIEQNDGKIQQQEVKIDYAQRLQEYKREIFILSCVKCLGSTPFIKQLQEEDDKPMYLTRVMNEQLIGEKDNNKSDYKRDGNDYLNKKENNIQQSSSSKLSSLSIRPFKQLNYFICSDEHWLKQCSITFNHFIHSNYPQIAQYSSLYTNHQSQQEIILQNAPSHGPPVSLHLISVLSDFLASPFIRQIQFGLIQRNINIFNNKEEISQLSIDPKFKSIQETNPHKSQVINLQSSSSFQSQSISHSRLPSLLVQLSEQISHFQSYTQTLLNLLSSRFLSFEGIHVALSGTCSPRIHRCILNFLLNHLSTPNSLLSTLKECFEEIENIRNGLIQDNNNKEQKQQQNKININSSQSEINNSKYNSNFNSSNKTNKSIETDWIREPIFSIGILIPQQQSQSQSYSSWSEYSNIPLSSITPLDLLPNFQTLSRSLSLFPQNLFNSQPAFIFDIAQLLRNICKDVELLLAVWIPKLILWKHSTESYKPQGYNIIGKDQNEQNSQIYYGAKNEIKNNQLNNKENNKLISLTLGWMTDGIQRMIADVKDEKSFQVQVKIRNQTENKEKYKVNDKLIYNSDRNSDYRRNISEKETDQSQSSEKDNNKIYQNTLSEIFRRIISQYHKNAHQGDNSLQIPQQQQQNQSDSSPYIPAFLIQAPSQQSSSLETQPQKKIFYSSNSQLQSSQHKSSQQQQSSFIDIPDYQLVQRVQNYFNNALNNQSQSQSQLQEDRLRETNKVGVHVLPNDELNQQNQQLNESELLQPTAKQTKLTNISSTDYSTASSAKDLSTPLRQESRNSVLLFPFILVVDPYLFQRKNNINIEKEKEKDQEGGEGENIDENKSNNLETLIFILHSLFDTFTIRDYANQSRLSTQQKQTQIQQFSIFQVFKQSFSSSSSSIQHDSDSSASIILQLVNSFPFALFWTLLKRVQIQEKQKDDEKNNGLKQNEEKLIDRENTLRIVKSFISYYIWLIECFCLSAQSSEYEQYSALQGIMKCFINILKKNTALNTNVNMVDQDLLNINNNNNIFQRTTLSRMILYTDSITSISKLISQFYRLISETNKMNDERVIQNKQQSQSQQLKSFQIQQQYNNGISQLSSQLKEYIQQFFSNGNFFRTLEDVQSLASKELCTTSLQAFLSFITVIPSSSNDDINQLSNQVIQIIQSSSPPQSTSIQQLLTQIFRSRTQQQQSYSQQSSNQQIIFSSHIAFLSISPLISLASLNILYQIDENEMQQNQYQERRSKFRNRNRDEIRLIQDVEKECEKQGIDINMIFKEQNKINKQQIGQKRENILEQKQQVKRYVPDFLLNQDNVNFSQKEISSNKQLQFIKNEQDSSNQEDWRIILQNSRGIQLFVDIALSLRKYLVQVSSDQTRKFQNEFNKKIEQNKTITNSTQSKEQFSNFPSLLARFVEIIIDYAQIMMSNANKISPVLNKYGELMTKPYIIEIQLIETISSFLNGFSHFCKLKINKQKIIEKSINEGKREQNITFGDMEMNEKFNGQLNDDYGIDKIYNEEEQLQEEQGDNEYLQQKDICKDDSIQLNNAVRDSVVDYYASKADSQTGDTDASSISIDYLDDVIKMQKNKKFNQSNKQNNQLTQVSFNNQSINSYTSPIILPSPIQFVTKDLMRNINNCMLNVIENGSLEALLRSYDCLLSLAYIIPYTYSDDNEQNNQNKQPDQSFALQIVSEIIISSATALKAVKQNQLHDLASAALIFAFSLPIIKIQGIFTDFSQSLPNNKSQTDNSKSKRNITDSNLQPHSVLLGTILSLCSTQIGLIPLSIEIILPVISRFPNIAIPHLIPFLCYITSWGPLPDCGANEKLTKTLFNSLQKKDQPFYKQCQQICDQQDMNELDINNEDDVDGFEAVNKAHMFVEAQPEHMLRKEKRQQRKENIAKQSEDRKKQSERKQFEDDDDDEIEILDVKVIDQIKTSKQTKSNRNQQESDELYVQSSNNDLNNQNENIIKSNEEQFRSLFQGAGAIGSLIDCKHLHFETDETNFELSRNKQHEYNLFFAEEYLVQQAANRRNNLEARLVQRRWLEFCSVLSWNSGLIITLKNTQFDRNDETSKDKQINNENSDTFNTITPHSHSCIKLGVLLLKYVLYQASQDQDKGGKVSEYQKTRMKISAEPQDSYQPYDDIHRKRIILWQTACALSLFVPHLFTETGNQIGIRMSDFEENEEEQKEQMENEKKNNQNVNFPNQIPGLPHSFLLRIVEQTNLSTVRAYIELFLSFYFISADFIDTMQKGSKNQLVKFIIPLLQNPTIKALTIATLMRVATSYLQFGMNGTQIQTLIQIPNKYNNKQNEKLKLDDNQNDNQNNNTDIENLRREILTAVLPWASSHINPVRTYAQVLLTALLPNRQSNHPITTQKQSVLESLLLPFVSFFEQNPEARLAQIKYGQSILLKIHPLSVMLNIPVLMLALRENVCGQIKAATNNSARFLPVREVMFIRANIDRMGRKELIRQFNIKETDYIESKTSHVEDNNDTLNVQDEITNDCDLFSEKSEMRQALMQFQRKPTPGTLSSSPNQEQMINSSLPVLTQNQEQIRQRLPLIIVASFVQKAPNLGGLCRTCEVFGASLLVVSDLTIKSDPIFRTLAVTSDRWLAMHEVKQNNVCSYLAQQKAQGFTIVGLEQTSNSVQLGQYEFSENCVIVLGDEKEGIPVDVLKNVDVCVEIPQLGVIRSLNVHTSASIIIWEYMQQHLKHQKR